MRNLLARQVGRLVHEAGGDPSSDGGQLDAKRTFVMCGHVSTRGIRLIARAPAAEMSPGDFDSRVGKVHTVLRGRHASMNESYMKSFSDLNRMLRPSANEMEIEPRDHFGVGHFQDDLPTRALPRSPGMGD